MSVERTFPPVSRPEDLQAWVRPLLCVLALYMSPELFDWSGCLSSQGLPFDCQPLLSSRVGKLQAGSLHAAAPLQTLSGA